jgi:hypothetical protein
MDRFMEDLKIKIQFEYLNLTKNIHEKNYLLFFSKELVFQNSHKDEIGRLVGESPSKCRKL